MRSVNPWTTTEPVFVARLGALLPTAVTVIATVSTSVALFVSVVVTVSVSPPL
jgi:hypothetical protein